MANTIRDYSATAASNTTVDGADISEGCSPAGINDAIRGVMADLKDVSTGAVSLESPAADSLSLSGALTTTSTIDGRDVAADGTKLDTIESSADVTDAGNVNPLVDAHLNQSTAASGELLSWNGSDYDWIAAGGGGDLLAANNLSDLANAATARTNLGLGTAATTASTDYATAAQGTTADAALPRTGGAMTGAITTNSTFDGRDVAVDGAKLDGIEAGATADQTAAEIRAAVEAATDSNVFTDADHTKLNGIATGATAYSDSDVDTHLNTSTAATNEVLSWNGSDYDWVAQSGGGGSPDLFDESYDGTSTAPSATGTNSVAIGKGSTASGQESMAVLDGNAVSQDSFSLGGNVYANAIGGTQIGKAGIVGGYGFTANYAVSIGYQAIAAKTESIAIGKGYSGGTNSFAAQITNNSTSYGATGNNSIAIGRLAKATGQDAIAIGDTTQATATNAIAFGNFGVASAVKSSVFGGDGNAASGSKSVAIGGYYAEAREEAKIAFGGGYIGTGPGTHAYQAGLLCMGADTTDATATILRSSNVAAGTTNQVILPNNSAFSFHGTIVARESAASGTDCAAWKVEGLIRREGSAGTTVLVNSATTVLDNTPSWGMALSADTTNGGLKIEVTGAAATNIRWVGTIHTSEVTYA